MSRDSPNCWKAFPFATMFTAHPKKKKCTHFIKMGGLLINLPELKATEQRIVPVFMVDKKI